MKKSTDKLHLLEIAALLAVAVTLIWGIWSLQEQDALEKKMIRLHVLANSDEQYDQELKLVVLDRVLAEATALLEESADMQDARTRLENALPQLEQTARQEIAAQGYDYTVSARLENTEFPLKEYDGFALPAGEYLALRVLIGDAEGQNWWCVVYPPLCTTAVTEMEETAMSAGLGKGDLSLITEENTGYVLKFHSLELWESLRQWIKKR
jgi:stage II sporulation protein R